MMSKSVNSSKFNSPPLSRRCSSGSEAEPTSRHSSSGDEAKYKRTMLRHDAPLEKKTSLEWLEETRSEEKEKEAASSSKGKGKAKADDGDRMNHVPLPTRLTSPRISRKKKAKGVTMGGVRGSDSSSLSEEDLLKRETLKPEKYTYGRGMKFRGYDSDGVSDYGYSSRD